MTDKKNLTYADAGVDIAAGNALVDRIKPMVKATLRPEVLGGLGGFSALFELDTRRYENPVLVSCTDGVGTKLKLAESLNRYNTIGIDLVAMCVNDLIVGGAEPLFFLDYYACGQLNVDAAASVIEGIAEGCKQSGCALVGGETAEMPGVYQKNDFDLAGFCVGVVDKHKILDGSQIEVGDKVIALASSGPHSNGYSLVRKIIETTQADLNTTLSDDRTLADALMAPTKIYVQSLLPLCQQGQIKGMAHITGGGFIENIPRILPEHVSVHIDLTSYERPAIFKWLQEGGDLEEHEMLRTFNCGVGMVLIVSEAHVKSVLSHCHQKGENAWVIGEVTPFGQGDRVTFTG